MEYASDVGSDWEVTDDRIEWTVDAGNKDTLPEAIAHLLKRRLGAGKVGLTLIINEG